MSQPTNPGGRPAIGPAISVAYPESLLAEVDADANRQHMSRAQWLREAAAAALPHQTLQCKPELQEAMGDLDADLAGRREWALNAEYPLEERTFQAEAYSSTIHELRTLLGQMRDALPKQDARDAYAQAEASEPENSPVTAKAWGRSNAAEMMDSILDAITMMLPVDGVGVRDRAELDDPNENLD